MSEKIGVAIAGYGCMGSIYAETVRRLRGTQLLYVVGRNKEKLEKFVSNYDNCKGVQDLNEALKDERVKAVIVASPNNTHFKYVIASLEAGKSVLCEKPLSLSLEETKKCFETAKNKGVALITGFQRRFDSSFAQLKSNLDKKTIGDFPEIIKITSRDPASTEEPNPNEEKTHAIWDSLIHDFDMANWLAGGQKVSEVYCVQPNPNAIIAIVKFENGTIATIDWAKGINYGYDQRVEVHCSGGMIQVSNETKSLINISSSTGKQEDNLKPFFTERYPVAYERQVQHFLDVARNPKTAQPLITSDQVINGAHIAELALQSLNRTQKELLLSVPKPQIDVSLDCVSGKKLEGTIGVCLIGAGRMGSIRANLMAKESRVKLLWINDVVEEMGVKLANQFNAKFTKNLTEALNDPNVNAVWISVSTPYHMAVIREAAKHKKHIYCEKPISLNVEEVDEAFRLAKENGVMLMCGWNRRFDPHFGKVQTLLQDEKSGAGKPSTISIHNGDHPLPPVKILVELGSIYHDFMVHDVDLAVWVAGQYPTSLYATGTTFSEELKKAGVLDSGAFVLTFPDGSVALATARRSSLHGYDQRLEVLTNNGNLIQAENIPVSSVVTSGINSQGFGSISSKINHTFSDRYDQAYGNEVVHLADVLLNGIPPRSTYQQCKLVAVITDLALKSSQEKKIIVWDQK